MKKKKTWPARLLSLLLAAVLICQMAGPALAAAADSFADISSFTDISSDPNPWYREDVAIACSTGMMVGTSDTTFSPHGNLSIGELIVLAARLHEYSRRGTLTLRVETGKEWYAPARHYLFTYGVRSGYFNELVCDGHESEPASRSLMAQAVYAALSQDTYTETNSVPWDTIPDVRNGETGSTDIYTLYRAGILTGDAETHSFHPDDPIERCQVAAILARALYPERRLSFSLGSDSESPGVSPAPEAPSNSGSSSPGKPQLPLDLPDYHAPVTEENILAVLDALDPDAAYYVRETLDTGKLMAYFEGIDTICVGLPLATHEMCHYFCYDVDDFFLEARYYIGNRKSVMVSVTRSYDATEIDSIVPDSLKTGRYRTYINPETTKKNESTRKLGIYGLMHEFTAYCWGATDTLRLLDYARTGSPLQVDDWVAHGEFLYYILTYMLYAKDHYPDIYRETMANRELLRAFREVNQTYTDTVAKLHEKQSGHIYGQERYDSFMEAISTDEYRHMLDLMLKS